MVIILHPDKHTRKSTLGQTIVWNKSEIIINLVSFVDKTRLYTRSEKFKDKWIYNELLFISSLICSFFTHANLEEDANNEKLPTAYFIL